MARKKRSKLPKTEAELNAVKSKNLKRIYKAHPGLKKAFADIDTFGLQVKDFDFTMKESIFRQAEAGHVTIRQADAMINTARYLFNRVFGTKDAKPKEYCYDRLHGAQSWR